MVWYASSSTDFSLLSSVKVTRRRFQEISVTSDFGLFLNLEAVLSTWYFTASSDFAVRTKKMDDRKRKGYAWAISAGSCAAMAAISAKLSILLFVRYVLVVLFNVVMWACYVNSLKALSSLQATVINFATNFISSGLAGFFLFEEAVSYQWFAGALLIVIGVFILSRSGVEKVSTE